MGIPWTSLRLTIQGIAGLQLWSKAIEPYWGAKLAESCFCSSFLPSLALVPLSSLLYHRVAKPGRQMTRHHIAQAAYETELNAMHIAAGLGSCEAMEALSHGTAESDLPRRWAGGSLGLGWCCSMETNGKGLIVTDSRNPSCSKMNLGYLRV